MMLQTPDPNKIQETQGLYTKLEGTIKSAGNLQKNLISGFKELVDNVSKFDDELIKASRSLGQSMEYAQSLEQRLGRVSQKMVQIGYDSNDVIALFKSMSDQIGRTVDFSEKALFNMALLKRVGVADESIKSFNKLFDSIGGTFEEATILQMDLVNQAKSYGLNVGQFMTSVAGQLTKINQYGFPNGVKDLGEMVAKSKLLGGNIELAAGLADKIMGSPETALDLAAQLQTLGGSFASLGDPMELLFLAQNDLAGLNDKLMDATKGLATFNKETGQFEIGINERIRIGKVASAFGTDSKSIIENATKLAKQQEIIKQFDLSGVFKGIKPEDQQTLAAFAQIGKEGKVTIEGQSLEEFTRSGPKAMNDLLEKLKGTGSNLLTQEDGIKNNINVTQQQSSILEKVNIQQQQYNDTLSLAAITTGNFNKVLETASTQLVNLYKVGTLSKGIAEASVSDLIGKAKTQLGSLTASTESNGNIGLDKLVEILSATAASKGTNTNIEVTSKEPIKIEITSAFNIDEVVRGALEKAMNQKIKDAVIEQTTGKTGAAVPYASGKSGTSN